MKRLYWNFKTFLDENQITPYRLRKELGGSVSHSLVYDWSKGPPQHLHLDVLEKVLAALEVVTGKDIKLSDILEYKVDDSQQS